MQRGDLYASVNESADSAIITIALQFLDTTHSLSALKVFRRGARGDLHRFHLLNVLRVRGFRATQRGLLRYPVFRRKVAKNVILAGQKTRYFSCRNDGSVRRDFTREWRNHLVGIIDPTGF